MRKYTFTEKVFAAMYLLSAIVLIADIFFLRP
jgi:hypothetical protein